MTESDPYGLILLLSSMLILALIGWALTLKVWRSRTRDLAKMVREVKTMTGDLVEEMNAKVEEVDLTDCPRNCPHNEVPCCHWCPLNGCLLELDGDKVIHHVPEEVES